MWGNGSSCPKLRRRKNVEEEVRSRGNLLAKGGAKEGEGEVIARRGLVEGAGGTLIYLERLIHWFGDNVAVSGVELEGDDFQHQTDTTAPRSVASSVS